jgi:adenylate kinase family enzyme
MFESLSERILIIGNSGTGKSTLASALAGLVHAPVIDLDLLHWEEDGYGRKRDEDSARQMTLEVSSQPRWIIEGVFGWLAEVTLPKATTLIWLDFPWSLCRAGLLARGKRRGATSQDATDLMRWAEAYWIPRHQVRSPATQRFSRTFPVPNSGWRTENRLPNCSLTYALAQSLGCAVSRA